MCAFIDLVITYLFICVFVSYRVIDLCINLSNNTCIDVVVRLCIQSLINLCIDLCNYLLFCIIVLYDVVLFSICLSNVFMYLQT